MRDERVRDVENTTKYMIRIFKEWCNDLHVCYIDINEKKTVKAV